ncbi:19803_t:CDS:2, partial [Funneliformis geosporum]
CHETTHTNFDTYENYLTNILKITDLNNLPLPPTDLTTLINFYLNPPTHPCPPCSLPHLPEPHVCPPTCSETYHRQLEQAVIEELNTHLGLGLKEPTSNQMVNHLNQLLRKPFRGVTNSQPVSPIIKRGVDLENIQQTSLCFLKEILSTIPQEVQKNILSAQNYQEIVQIEKKLIQASFGEQFQTNRILQEETYMRGIVRYKVNYGSYFEVNRDRVGRVLEVENGNNDYFKD